MSLIEGYDVKPFHELMAEYRRQMEKGDIRDAYKGLIEFMMRLRSNFKAKHPDFVVSGSLYPGYMDMTYFSFFPESLELRKLKVAVVFLHDTCRFEAWLAGYNKQIQSRYWTSFKKSGWNKYRMPAATKGADSILEHVLDGNPDFRDLDALSDRIESGTLDFIKNVEDFLSKTPDV